MAKRKYPELYDPDTFKKLQEECGSDVAIARKLGCYPETVRCARHVLGIPDIYHQGFGRLHALYDRDAFMALRPAERTTADMAAELGCSMHTIQAAYRRFGVQKDWHDNISPMLRHPDVLAYLMKRYNSDITRVAEIAGARPSNVRGAIARFREEGYTI